MGEVGECNGRKARGVRGLSILACVCVDKGLVFDEGRTRTRRGGACEKDGLDGGRDGV